MYTATDAADATPLIGGSYAGSARERFCFRFDLVAAVATAALSPARSFTVRISMSWCASSVESCSIGCVAGTSGAEWPRSLARLLEGGGVSERVDAAHADIAATDDDAVVHQCRRRGVGCRHEGSTRR